MHGFAPRVSSISIAVTQLFQLDTVMSNNSSTGDDPCLKPRQLGKPLGVTFLEVSILALSVGFYGYFETQHWIIRRKFPRSRGSVAFIAAIALALMITGLIVVFVVEPISFERKRI